MRRPNGAVRAGEWTARAGSWGQSAGACVRSRYAHRIASHRHGTPCTRTSAGSAIGSPSASRPSSARARSSSLPVILADSAVLDPAARLVAPTPAPTAWLLCAETAAVLWFTALFAPRAWWPRAVVLRCTSRSPVSRIGGWPGPTAARSGRGRWWWQGAPVGQRNHRGPSHPGVWPMRALSRLRRRLCNPRRARRPRLPVVGSHSRTVRSVLVVASRVRPSVRDNESDTTCGELGSRQAPRGVLGCPQIEFEVIGRKRRCPRP
jgi:hypothetical protein